ncbi:MAG: SGNH/GDSL hydrolase family protein [Acidimicrobiales bacterium]
MVPPSVLCVLAALTTILGFPWLAPGSVPSGPPTPWNYVALGDSYTSGPFIPDQVGTPTLCLRSDHNYPSLAARANRVHSFSDASCQGATIDDMSGSQNITLLGYGPALERDMPQLDALSPTTTLVTVGIGGNDAGLFQAGVTCAEMSVDDPFGSPCRAHFTAGGTDQLAQAVAATAPKLAALVREIHRRSPQALVFLVGYPDIFPTSGSGCYPILPIASGDIGYLNGLVLKLNRMIADQAQANGAFFVDTYTSSIGHDACQLPGTKWVEGAIPTSLASPVHPNALGMVNVARQFQTALNLATGQADPTQSSGR